MKFIIGVFFVLIFADCLTKPKPVPEISADEYAVINTVLKLAVPSDNDYRKEQLYYIDPSFTPRFPPAGYKITAHDKSKQVARYDSIKRVLDTAKLYVFICDSLMKFPSTQLKYASHFNIAKLKQMQVEDPKATLRIMLAVDTNTKGRRLDRHQINKLYHYQSIFYTGTSSHKDDTWGPGEIMLSRVAFNSRKTLAAVCVITHRNFKYAHGEMVYLQKVKGQWVLAGRHLLWIA